MAAPLSSELAALGNLGRHGEMFEVTDKSIKSLPGSIGNLGALLALDLSGCELLASLPESIGNLSALLALDLSGCKQLASLPESIANLSALQTLDLSGCEQLTSLPKSIGNLSALQTLDLFGCKGLELLPESIGLLSGLQTLWGNRDRSGSQDLFGGPCFDGAPRNASAWDQIRWALREQTKRRNAEALLGQREILLTSVERMSWIAILFATATFVGFLNPPGSFNEGKLLIDDGAPAGKVNKPEPRVTDANLLRAFFIADQLAFFASLATVVVAVATSMPSTAYKNKILEASKIWALLVMTSALLSVAIVCGLLAFTFAALCLYPLQHRPDVVGPVVIGACLVVSGLVYHLVNLFRISPGVRNVWKWIWVWWRSCCGRRRRDTASERTVELSDAAQANQLLRQQNVLLAALQQNPRRGANGYAAVPGDDIP